MRPVKKAKAQFILNRKKKQKQKKKRMRTTASELERFPRKLRNVAKNKQTNKKRALFEKSAEKRKERGTSAKSR